ncbi:MAG: hypothetical protein K2L49_03075, partial [Muribaculaceae bacterium]|nr:hypothetical protein [Muribaculaceae bacterium]
VYIRTIHRPCINIMIPNDRKFCCFETITTLCLAVVPAMIYGEALVIPASMACSCVLAWIIWNGKQTWLLWFLTWCGAMTAYILDIAAIASMHLISTDTADLLFAQLLLLPIYFVYSGIVCLAGWIVMTRAYRSKWFVTAIYCIASIVGSIGAGFNIGVGKNGYLFIVFMAIAITGALMLDRQLRNLPVKGFIWIFRWGYKTEIIQNGKPKTDPLTVYDYLYQLRYTFPMFLVGCFIMAAFISDML